MEGLFASFECEVLLSGSSSSSRLKREDWKMKNKAKAEKTETRLFNTYDYAWNEGNNGDRRHEEVLQKPNLSKKQSGFHQKKTGVKGTFKSFSWEEGSGPSGTYTNWESNEETFFKKPPEVRGKGCEVHKWRTNASKSSSVFDSPFEGRRLKVEKGVGSIQACGAMLSKKIILLFVELPQLTVPLAEGRRLKVEKGVGSIQACGAIERLSLETRGVTGTKEKESPPTK